MTTRVEIISTGSELLHDKTKNTTTPFLISQLTELGYEIKRISTVDDGIEEITGAVLEVLRRADLIFITGGLGAPKHSSLINCYHSLVSPAPLTGSGEESLHKDIPCHRQVPDIH
jgi:molybdopterin biosynthesis enzyme